MIMKLEFVKKTLAYKECGMKHVVIRNTLLMA